jgi:hypothetical protein
MATFRDKCQGDSGPPWSLSVRPSCRTILSVSSAWPASGGRTKPSSLTSARSEARPSGFWRKRKSHASAISRCRRGSSPGRCGGWRRCSSCQEYREHIATVRLIPGETTQRSVTSHNSLLGVLLGYSGPTGPCVCPRSSVIILCGGSGWAGGAWRALDSLSTSRGHAAALRGGKRMSSPRFTVPPWEG